MHCPTGQKYKTKTQVSYENYDEKLKQWFDSNCQKHARETLNGCEWNWNQKGFGCGTIFGPLMEWWGHKGPCIIHDMCYESGRAKNDCDVEFRKNLAETGMLRENRWIVYWSVRDHGKIRGKKC